MPARQARPAASSSSEEEDQTAGSGAASEDELSDVEEATLEALRSTIKSLPLAERERLQLHGINGVPLEKALRTSSAASSSLQQPGAASFPSSSSAPAKRNDLAPHLPRPANKHAPPERSSKIQVSRDRAVIDVPNRRAKDPRFTSEPVNYDSFRNGYKFLEEQVSEEITQMRGVMKREQEGRALGGRKGRKKRKLTDEQLGELQSHLTRAEQFQAQARRSEQTQQAVRQFKRETGKLYVPSAIRKQIALNRRFADLEKRGKLDRFMMKKRRKGARGPGKESVGPVLGI